MKFNDKTRKYDKNMDFDILNGMSEQKAKKQSGRQRGPKVVDDKNNNNLIF